MAIEFVFTIATNEYSCPKCNTNKGEVCRMPSGRKCSKPHIQRVLQLTDNDIERCELKVSNGY